MHRLVVVFAVALFAFSALAQIDVASPSMKHVGTGFSPSPVSLTR